MTIIIIREDFFLWRIWKIWNLKRSCLKIVFCGGKKKIFEVRCQVDHWKRLFGDLSICLSVWQEKKVWKKNVASWIMEKSPQWRTENKWAQKLEKMVERKVPKRRSEAGDMFCKLGHWIFASCRFQLVFASDFFARFSCSKVAQKCRNNGKIFWQMKIFFWERKTLSDFYSISYCAWTQVKKFVLFRIIFSRKNCRKKNKFYPSAKYKFWSHLIAPIIRGKNIFWA